MRLEGVLNGLTGVPIRLPTGFWISFGLLLRKATGLAMPPLTGYRYPRLLNKLVLQLLSKKKLEGRDSLIRAFAPP